MFVPIASNYNVNIKSRRKSSPLQANWPLSWDTSNELLRKLKKCGPWLDTGKYTKALLPDFTSVDAEFLVEETTGQIVDKYRPITGS